MPPWSLQRVLPHAGNRRHGFPPFWRDAAPHRGFVDFALERFDCMGCFPIFLL
jgi:hypothetical protein